MVLTTIFVIRHGFRSNWSVDSRTGEITSTLPSPTNIPSDPALTAHGDKQANELAQLADVLEPKVKRIYTSPFYRCIQTVQPLATRLPGVPLICDRGLGEWYGTAHFIHPSAAPLPLLQTFFPFLVESTSLSPASSGEGIAELHDRCAYVLARIISEVDAASSTDEAESIVVSSHAAPIIAIGRALTGSMPEDPTTVDFHTYTCSVSKFTRKGSNKASVSRMPGGQLPLTIDWKNGKGVGGGWLCEVNAGVDHLSNGGERDWHFSGDESFIDEIPAGMEAKLKVTSTGVETEKSSKL